MNRPPNEPNATPASSTSTSEGRKPRRSKPSLIERAAEQLAGVGADALAGPASVTLGGGAPLTRATSRRADIDLDKVRAMGMVVPNGVRTRMAEEYRVIKRPLLAKALGRGRTTVKNGNLIMVASATPSEGKTFTSINLAMSMASERELHVLLVDADFTRPSIATLLGIECDRGLVDYLDDDSIDLADVLIRTNIDNLTVLPAGRTHPMGTELLASERMARLVEEMARRYPDRIIIFDTAPVLACSEASALAPHIGQVIFLVEAERTTEGAVRSSLELLSGCENIGLVLNKARSKASAEGFGYYYSPYYQQD